MPAKTTEQLVNETLPERLQVVLSDNIGSGDSRGARRDDGAAARAAAGQFGVEPTPGRLVLAALIVLTLEARRGEMTLGQVRLLEKLVRSTKVEG